MQSIKNWISWDILKHLGSNRLLAASSFFLFSVPIIARLLSKFPDTLKIPITNHILILPLTLPFSWVMLFFAALFFLSGNLFYFVFCPRIVRDYSGLEDYESAGRSVLDLTGHLKAIVPGSLAAQLVPGNDEKAQRAREEALKYIFENYLGSTVHDLRRGSLAEAISPGMQFHKAQEHLARAFTTLRDASNYARPLVRNFNVLLYIASILCFSCVLGQNISYVIKYILDI